MLGRVGGSGPLRRRATARWSTRVELVAVVVVTCLVAATVSATAAPAAAQARPMAGERLRIEDVPLIDSPESRPVPAELPAGVAGGTAGDAEGPGTDVTEPSAAAPAGDEPGAENDGSEALAAAANEREAADARGERVEVVEERAPNRRVFERPGGVLEVELSTDPLTYDTGDGTLAPIDTSLVAEGRSADGGYRSSANSWTAHFAPLDGQTGGLSVARGGHSVSLVPRGAAAVEPRRVEGDDSAVRYDAVWDETDLAYTVTSTAVKEDVVVRSAAAPHRFEFALSGARAARGQAGALELTGAAGTFTVPPVAVSDASGADVTAASGATLEPIDGGAAVAVAVNPTWLDELPESAFPVRIDPTIQPVLPSLYAQSWPSNGGAAISGLRVGRDAAGVLWRGQVGFDYADYLDHPYRLVGATVTLARPAGAAAGALQLWAPTAQSYAGTRGHPAYYLPYLCLPETGCATGPWDTGTGVEFDAPPHGCNRCHVRVKQNVQTWFDEGVTDAKVGVVPNGSLAGEIATYQATLRLFLQQPPPAATLTAPADGAVVATRTPTLVASPVTFTDDFPVRYRFDVSTGPNSVAVSSGWTEQPSWTVPEGSLRDGAHYTATVRTASLYMLGNDQPGEHSPTASVRHFRVDMGLGSGGPAPTERAGTVAGVTGTPSEGSPSPGTPGAELNVNLIDGNLAAAVPTHSVAATGAAIEPTLVYNSRADSDAGLTAEYYSDNDRDRVFDTSDTLRSRRLDPLVNFDWPLIDQMVGGMPPGADGLVRWTGFVRVPETGAWEFGLDVDGFAAGGRVYLNGEPTSAVDDWAAVPVLSAREARYGASRQLTAGTWVPIRVEFWGDFSGGIDLLAKRGETSYVVPQSWLSTGGSGLPQGWQLSVGAQESLDVVAVEDLGDAVLVVRTDGSSESFARLPGGGYESPHGEGEHMAVDGQGRLTLSTPGGLHYIFRPDGQIDQVTTVADDRNPAALAYAYGGTPVRLQSITDPVSDRSVTFAYGGAGCTAPAGTLCRISFWDGATTTLTYDTSGRLVRVANPGYQTAAGQNQPTLFDFGYNASNQLVSLREPLAADLVAYGTRPDAADLRTQFTYDNQSRLTSITPPLVAPGAEASTTTYTYNPGARTTTVQLAGFSPTSGFARRVRWDTSGRIVEQTDAAGLTTSFEWDAHSRPVARTEPGGARTTYAYDLMGNLTDVWGPAPSNQFGADNRPVAGASVPHESKSYDDGMQGLASAYWTNPLLAGAPAGHGSGAGSVGNWGGTPPVTPDGQGRWSMRLTGFVRFPAGQTTFAPDAGTGAVRLWIDDTLVVSNRAGLNGAHTETTTGGAWRRVRIDFASEAAGQTLNLRWRPPGAPAGQFVALPTASLKPGFGLHTRTVDADGMVEATEYTDAARHIGPHHRRATATVVDPAGMALRTAMRLEDPTVGGYLRPTGQVMPSGSVTATQYYADTAGPITATCGVTASTPQGGFVRQVTHPDPDGAGAQRSIVQQFVYDATGREAGSRRADAGSIGTAQWMCTTYDGRGRPTVRTFPSHGSSPARGVVWTYAYEGDPLSSMVYEPFAPTVPGVETTVDVRNRLTSYKTNGGESVRYYDRLGREFLVADNGIWTLSEFSASNGRLSKVTVSDGGFLGPPAPQHTVTAQPSYDAATGNMTNVAYSNGTTSGWVYDLAGRQTWALHGLTGGALFAGDIAARSGHGRITDRSTITAGDSFVDANPAGANYTYDTAGRLTRAWVPGMEYSYEYFTNGFCTAPDADRNTNRTRVTRTPTGGTPVATAYCYDHADRVTLTTDADMATASYDDRGNTTALGGQTYAWDAGDRNIGIRAGSTVIDYVRDPLDRITERRTGGETIRYRYGGFGDAPTAATNGSGQVIERYASLPGGAQVTLSATGTSEVWSYMDITGHVTATTDRAGHRNQDPYIYEPGGMEVSGAANTNVGARDAGYLGSHARFTERGTNVVPVIDMGARPYNVELGRFLTTDPVAGGCANAYVLVYGDPLNNTDVSGQSCHRDRGGLWGFFDDVHDFVDNGLRSLGLFGAALAFVTIAITATNPVTYALALGAAVAAAAGSGYYLYRTTQDGSAVFKKCP